jgi:hypothetical protein
VTRWQSFKQDAAVYLAFALMLVIIVVSIGYPIAKEVQWWRTSRALERRP